MKKIISTILLLISMPVYAQPLNLSDWKQPMINQSVQYNNYTSVLNCGKKTPYYVFYNLYQSDFGSDNSRRKEKWSGSVPTEIKLICGASYATKKDYTKSGYDKGHLAPAGDFASNQYNENSTFSFANAAPQNKTLNRGEWEKLERFERDSAINHAGITVITGVIQSQNNYIGNNVGVPNYYYKIILWKDNGEIKYNAYLAQNINCNAEIPQVNIKFLENKADFDFGL